jgi:hypothetical protein
MPVAQSIVRTMCEADVFGGRSFQRPACPLGEAGRSAVLVIFDAAPFVRAMDRLGEESSGTDSFRETLASF